MTKFIFTLVLSAFCSIIGFSKIQVFFQYSLFNVPTQEPYIETYLTAMGKSVRFVKNQNNKFQASVMITLIFKQTDQVKSFKKYNLQSPEIDDTLKGFPNFVDQQRISLPSGIYNFELLIDDNNYPGEPNTYRDIISIDFPPDNISFSGIQLLEKYELSQTPGIITKNGYDLYPYVADFFPDNMNKLKFYAEIYNTAKILKTDDFLLRYSIESAASGKPLSEFTSFKKLKPQEVYVVLSEFDIEKLPSGNYNLSIEVINKENKNLGTKKIFFQRSKIAKQNDDDYASIDISNSFVTSITNKDTLIEYLKCIRPISNEAEKRFTSNVLKRDSVIYMQQFFYNFWQSRNYANPQEEWNKYYDQVKLVNRLFKTMIHKGYESDRGRIYLQYGSPNDITQNKFDPVAYPNEIWQYNSLRGQSNLKFIFYNIDISSNNFDLLHSDLKGEVQNPKWENVIYSRHEGKDIPTGNMQGNEHFSGGNNSKGKVSGRIDKNNP